jgi:hypothetical protein
MTRNLVSELLTLAMIQGDWWNIWRWLIRRQLMEGTAGGKILIIGQLTSKCGKVTRWLYLEHLWCQVPGTSHFVEKHT